MAFETLAVRSASAVVLAPMFLWILHLGGPSLALLLTAVALISLTEFCAMARAASHAPSRPLASLGALAIFAGAYAYGFEGAALAMALFPTLLILPYLAVEDFSRAVVDSSLTLYGTIHFAYFLSFLYLLRADSGRSFGAVAALLAMVWVQDIGAYLAGSAFGKTKLTPISPKKSWEGTLAGFVIALAAAGAILHFGLGHPVGPWTVALLGIVGILAQLGDLSESLLKRNFGVKDSGNLIPGHGGLLDRFDSLCYSAPAMYALYPWM